MYVATELKWNQVHYKWNDINFGPAYQQYLLETYGIIAINGRVLWGYVIEVTIIPEPGTGQQGGAPGDYPEQKRRKKIKLIFIMEDLQKEQTKIPVTKKMSVGYVGDIQNYIEQQIDAKITLRDVQIIKG